MQGKTIHELTVGESASLSKTIAESDVYLFAGITGDFNPMHVNQPYAEKTHFGGRIAHGILSAGLISAALATYLPGPGGIYLSQDLKFLAPVRIGDTVTATVTVKELNVERNRAVLDTVCVNQDGVTLISGQALVMPRKE